MTTTSRASALALGLAGAVALASPSLAAPVFSSAAGVKAAASDNVVDVRWRRGGGGAVAAGVAAGLFAGAALSAATAPRYYGYPYGAYAYDYPAYPAYSYSYPAYGAYANAPVYGWGFSSYAYPTQTCGIYGGYGRWDYSQC